MILVDFVHEEMLEEFPPASQYAFDKFISHMVFVYSQLTTPTALLLGGAVMGLFVNGMLGGYGALISELYPTEARAAAQNILFNMGRAVGGIGPLLIGFLIKSYSFPITVSFLSLIYLLDICATALLIPERKGKQLPSLHKSEKAI